MVFRGCIWLVFANTKPVQHALTNGTKIQLQNHNCARLNGRNITGKKQTFIWISNLKQHAQTIHSTLDKTCTIKQTTFLERNGQMFGFTQNVANWKVFFYKKNQEPIKIMDFFIKKNLPIFHWSRNIHDVMYRHPGSETNIALTNWVWQIYLNDPNQLGELKTSCPICRQLTNQIPRFISVVNVIGHKVKNKNVGNIHDVMYVVVNGIYSYPTDIIL